MTIFLLANYGSSLPIEKDLGETMVFELVQWTLFLRYSKADVNESETNQRDN